VFVEIVLESGAGHIYKAVPLAIKIAARNVSRARARNTIKHPTSKTIDNIIQRNWT
jgi:hypothetical protein